MSPETTATPDIPQSVSDLPSPVTEAPVPASAPEAHLQPAEAVPAFETAPDSAEATTGTQSPTPTAQIPPNEPLPPEPEPIQPPSAAANTPTPARHIRDFLTRARIATQDRKRKKRDKIMLALTTKSKITNDEVEKLLHVSDATATRYLSALEKENKIRQVGKTGTGVVYQKF